jgi:hypothetical protein
VNKRFWHVKVQKLNVVSRTIQRDSSHELHEERRTSCFICSNLQDEVSEDKHCGTHQTYLTLFHRPSITARFPLRPNKPGARWFFPFKVRVPHQVACYYIQLSEHSWYFHVLSFSHLTWNSSRSDCSAGVRVS